MCVQTGSCYTACMWFMGEVAYTSIEGLHNLLIFLQSGEEFCELVSGGTDSRYG